MARTYTQNCRYCGKDFSTHYKRRSYACGSYACQRARINDYRQKVLGMRKIEPRPCTHCSKMFSPKTKQANRRKFCYKPACVKKQRSYWQQVTRAASAEWRKKANGGYVQTKVCPLCGYKRMPANHHFSCNVCRANAGRLDGDHIYYGEVWREDVDLRWENV